MGSDKEDKKPFMCWIDDSGWPVYPLEEYKEGKRNPVAVLQIGDEVACRSWVGYSKATVTKKTEDGEYIAENEGTYFPLSFNADKNYWVCSVSMSKAAVRGVQVGIKEK